MSVDKVELPHQISEESVPEQPYTEVFPPAKKMRRDCEKCCIQRMMDILKSVILQPKSVHDIMSTQKTKSG